MKAKARKLTKRQRELFDRYLPMAEEKGRALAARYSRLATRDEIVQFAREGLWRACHAWRYLGYWEFEPFARQRIDWWITKSCFMVAGAAAARDAREYEVSGSEVIADNRKEVTLLEAAEDDLGDDEFQDDCAAEHEGDRYAEVLRAIQTAPDLNARERKILSLRLEGAEIETIVARLSDPSAGLHLHQAIRKLRAYFQAQGVSALPVDAPMPSLGWYR